jgi:hypothetical protein
MIETRAYLGDGAYVELTPCGEIRVYTSDGISEKNSVVMEGRPADLLIAFIRAHRERLVG